MKNDIKKWYTAVFIIGLTVIFGNSLCGASENNTNPSDKFFIAVKNNDRTAAKQAGDELIKMGNDAIPLLKGKVDLENRALTGWVMHVIRNIKTSASTEMLLDMCTRSQSISKGEYIAQETMQELQYRDIDVEVNEPVFNFMLGKLRENKSEFSPKVARIIGKMKKVAPQIRAEPLIKALKKEVSINFDSNTSQQTLPGAYATESQHKICQFIYALGDIGAPTVPLISEALDTADDNNFREYLTICLGFTNDNKTLPSKVKSEIIHLAKDSADGYTRLMAMRILEKWKDPNLVPIFKKGLNDNYKVAVRTDFITPDTLKDEDGSYYDDCYPVRDEAFSALLKLGVKVENKRKGVYKVIE
jgi:hypothetical protein